MFLTPADNVVIHQAFYFADAVKILTAYPGKSNGMFRPEPLQRFAADFKKCTYIVTVHPAIIRLSVHPALYCANEFYYQIDF
jgi:hypothetical protein